MVEGKRKPKPKQQRRAAATVLLEAPENAVRWDIGGREFCQWALSVRQTEKLLAVVVDEARQLAGTPVFGSLMNIDFAKTPAEELVPTLIAASQFVPTLFPRLLCVILRAEPADADFIADYATPAQALKIVETFIEQNEPQALIQSFFALSRQIGAMIPQKETTAEPEG